MLGAGLALSPPESSLDFTLHNHDTPNCICLLSPCLALSLCNAHTSLHILLICPFPFSQVRTIVQVSAVAVVTFFVVFFLDRNFRVLPSAIHEYMPQHHAGLLITDITIKRCSSLNVFTSCRLDPDKWHRIEKDLYLGKTLVSSAYIHVRRKKEEELTPEDKVVIDVTVGRLDPGTAVQGQADERWEVRDAGLWIKRSAKKQAIDSKQTITAVDVLFGDDAVEARDGWDLPEKSTPLLLDAGVHVPSAHITVRRGSQQEPKKPQPRVKENGKFKIMQVSDMHLSTGVGVCRDEMPEHPEGVKCEADPRTLDFITRVLEDEKPDLIVLSGDQINGDTAPDAQSVSPKTFCPHSRNRCAHADLTPRPSSNTRNCLSNTKCPTSPSLVITTMRVQLAPLCRAQTRWLWSRPCLIRFPNPVRTTSMESEIITLRCWAREAPSTRL